MNRCTFSEKSKYDDIAPLVLAIYQDYTKQEVADILGLTFQQVYHICFFNRKKLKQKTKDKREKLPWTTRDYKILFENIGKIPLREIGQKIGRTKRKDHSFCKEKLACLGINAHDLKGLRVEDFVFLFPHSNEVVRGRYKNRRRVPFSDCLDFALKYYGRDSFVCKMFDCYCMFKSWAKVH